MPKPKKQKHTDEAVSHNVQTGMQEPSSITESRRGYEAR